MTKIQLRRDTATNWSTNNPTPSAGEPCFETDTGKFKIGDGVTKYTNLPYQGGGGLEVCDIGMALYIDETKGLRRYLNGQVVDINTNTQAFLNRLKQITTLHPSLLCTEEEWQTAKTMSAFGQVGKFVFNYSDGEIVSVRLPRVVNIQGVFDLQNLGLTVEAGLPNITAETKFDQYIHRNQKGAFNGSDNKTIGVTTVSVSATNSKMLNFDASKSNPIYGNSNTVQQEAVQYPYFIQIATGSETENNIVNDIELNNPYSLFDNKYSDHELNNLSWLKSNGQWNAKAVYTDAYDELLTEYNNSASTTETEGSITFKRTPKGYKIALANQETAIDTKYSTDGIAWYYILDTTNEKFKLPRTKFGFEGLRTNVGDDISAGLPNITGAFTSVTGTGRLGTTNETGAFHKGAGGSGGATAAGSAAWNSLLFNASRSSSIYGKSSTVQPPATQMYLYFYVGETVQNANLIDAGRIGEQLAIKTDKVQAARASMPSNKYIDLTLGASGTTYTAPANGYYTLYKIATASNQFIQMVNVGSDGESTTNMVIRSVGNNDYVACKIPCAKGNQIQINYTLDDKTVYFRFCYAEGEI